MARSDKYWEQRALERLTLIERHSSEYFDQISKLYSEAKKLIYSDIERILQKYIRDSGLGAKEARELLSTRESQNILDELRKRLSTITDDQIRRQILNRLNAPAYRARISRLQAIEASIDTTIKQIAPLETGILEQSLIDTADLAYCRTMFDTQRGLGVNFSFSGLNEETVRSVMDEQWSGKHFSKRVWQNTDIVSAKLQEIVRQNVLTGRSWRRCMSDIEGFVDTKNAGAKFASERLLRTETNYVYNAINAKAYQSIGAEKYRYLATLDSRTSEVCRAHDGNIDPDTKKEYTYENMKIGKNYPPLHAFCRSVTTARLDPELEARLTRTARDPATGKAYQVPYSMTYPQWVKSLSPEQQNQMTLSRKMAANKASDLKQYEKYRATLDRDLPSSFKKFQDLKYRDPERWRYTKIDYERRNFLLQNPESALPNATQATAVSEKFTGYIFNSNSADGWPKGVAFDSRLGYNASNWQDLQSQILTRATQYPARAGLSDQYGTRFEQNIIIYGIKNKPANVVVGWNVLGTETKMTTAIVKEVK
jgi:SPP1 gp7 family putative phage head morphogenesis protein